MKKVILLVAVISLAVLSLSSCTNNYSPLENYANEIERNFNKISASDTLESAVGNKKD